MPNIALLTTAMYASALVLLSVGFTFTHIMEKFPNFAHISYSTIGTLIAYSLVRIVGVNPYIAIPIAAVMSGFIGMALYLLMVRPMKQAGTSAVHITFAMFALTYVVDTFLLIYSFWVMLNFRLRPASTGWLLRRFDTKIFGLPGITVVSPIMSVILVFAIHLFLTRNKFGIATRAVSEDPRLASSLGVNTFQIYLISWFITGALAGLAGASLSLWQPTYIERTDTLMVNVLAASILGGLDSIYGAIIGGIIIAFTQRLMPGMLIRAVGIWIAEYITLTPIILIVCVQLLIPQGIAGAFSKYQTLIRKLKAGVGRLIRSGS